MRIIDIWDKKKFTFSLEVFPPKKESENLESIKETIRQLVELKPDFISVTYGSGGSTNANTVLVAQSIKDLNVEPLAHLTCTGESSEQIDRYCARLESFDIRNIMALRGDEFDASIPNDFTHASDLIRYVSDKHRFSLAGACYPEKHKESTWLSDDIQAYLTKQEAGADFLISQLFFENSHFHKMVENARAAGVNVPIIAGVMPVTDPHQFIRIKKLTGASIPEALQERIEAHRDNKEAMFEIGINWAVFQIIGLISKGVDGIHLYTMNNPRVAKEIHRRIAVFL
jgi:methylenetetrahydrofolate reductase (NADPH)